jgi:hypothetical protein
MSLFGYQFGFTSSASSTTPPGPPTDSLVFWLDAADATTLHLDSGDVSQWDDKSTAGITPFVSQTTPSYRPIPGTLNGLASVFFTGGSLETLRGPSSPVTAAPFTVFFCRKPDYFIF